MGGIASHDEQFCTGNNSTDSSAFFISLNIVIVGCGLGGLTAAYKLGMAGHTVTVLERATALGEVGAGIQITPNVSRLLHRWGVLNRVGNVGIRPLGLTFLRYQNGERVGYTPLGDHMDRNHGAPYYHIHRADLLDILYDLARPYATIRLDARVVSVDPSAPTLTLHSGEVITADLIIGADGLNSMIREVVMGGPFPAVPTGDAAYRAVIPVAELENDPELKTLVETPQMTAWIGPGRHIVMYKIRPKHVNLVMCHPDRGAIESWTAQGDIDTMRHEFREFEPRVQKILSLVPLALEWRLMDRDPIPHWIHPDGKVALLGDACHPMLPYRAQGAAMAIEDAAVLGVLFSRVSDPAQIGCLLSAYETIRIRRATNTHMASRLNQKTFHYEDGPEQQARDASMREAMLRDSAADHVGNANQWADVQKSIEQFSYDAELAAENWWKENGKAVLDPVDSSALPDQYIISVAILSLPSPNVTNERRKRSICGYHKACISLSFEDTPSGWRWMITVHRKYRRISALDAGSRAISSERLASCRTHFRRVRKSCTTSSNLICASKVTELSEQPEHAEWWRTTIDESFYMTR